MAIHRPLRLPCRMPPGGDEQDRERNGGNPRRVRLQPVIRGTVRAGNGDRTGDAHRPVGEHQRVIRQPSVGGEQSGTTAPNGGDHRSHRDHCRDSCKQDSRLVVRASLHARCAPRSSGKHAHGDTHGEGDECVEVARGGRVEKQGDGEQNPEQADPTTPQRACEAAGGHGNDEQRRDGARPAGRFKVERQCNEEGVLELRDQQTDDRGDQSATYEGEQHPYTAHHPFGPAAHQQSGDDHDGYQRRVVHADQRQRQRAEVVDPLTSEFIEVHPHDAHAQDDSGKDHRCQPDILTAGDPGGNVHRKHPSLKRCSTTGMCTLRGAHSTGSGAGSPRVHHGR